MVLRAGCWTIAGSRTGSRKIWIGAAGRGRRGDREVEILDVPLVLESEDALECFGGRHPPRILDQDVDPAAGKIRGL
jgi:superfamily II DNA or RNA helicase